MKGFVLIVGTEYKYFWTNSITSSSFGIHHAPQSVQSLQIQRTEDVAHKRRKGTTKVLKVYKIYGIHDACAYVTVTGVTDIAINIFSAEGQGL